MQEIVKKGQLLTPSHRVKDFPILSEKVYGKELVYLDSAASTQKPLPVVKAMSYAYEHYYANVHRGAYFFSNQTTEAYEKARDMVRAFINAKQSKEIVFTKNATEAINLVAYSFMSQLKRGDEIILTIMEHHSNIVPWHFLREKLGVKLIFIGLDETGRLDQEAFSQAFSPRTKLVSITHMSNVLGTILPIKQMIAHAHAHNVPVLVDGTQAVAHFQVDVQDSEADWYVFTGHKLYGPTGIGVLYGKTEHLEAMPPFLGGGQMIQHVSTEKISYAAPPHRFEAGTPPIVEAIGLMEALAYVEAIGLEKLEQHDQQLVAYAQKSLLSIENLQIFGESFPKGGIVTFNLKNIHAHDLATFLDCEGVAVRAGTHCAQPLLDLFGVTALCRASFGIYNDFHDINVLVAALHKAQDFFHGR